MKNKRRIKRILDKKIRNRNIIRYRNIVRKSEKAVMKKNNRNKNIRTRIERTRNKRNNKTKNRKKVRRT